MTPADLYTVDRKRAVNAANEAMTLVYGKLDDAEREVLIYASKGFSCREAGEYLGTSAQQQHNRRKAVRRKLEVHSSEEAAVLAAKAGLV